MLYQFDLGFDLESCITNGDSGGIATPIFSGNDLVVDWEFEWVSLNRLTQLSLTMSNYRVFHS